MFEVVAAAILSCNENPIPDSLQYERCPLDSLPNNIYPGLVERY